jgi:hypothetical protein
MELATIMNIVLVTVAVVAILSGLLAMLAFNWLLMAMCWSVGVVSIWVVLKTEDEL